MTTQNNRINLEGSERAALAGARAVGPADPGQRIEVTVLVRRRPGSTGLPDLEDLGLRLPGERRALTHEEFAAVHSADPGDLDLIHEFAARFALTVTQESPARRSIVLTGTVEAFSKAFDVELQRCEHPTGNFRGRTGPVRLPAELDGVIEGVFGLDDRPQARPHFRRAMTPVGTRRPHAAPRSYSPVEISQLYNFPSGVNGTGQCIGIIELGGGFRTTDLGNFFRSLSLAAPTVVPVSVDGATNAPTGDPNGPDTEVALDIEIAGAVATGAKLAVYFAPNTDRGFLDALTTAVHDLANKPSVISISWGGPESSWTRQALRSFNEVCREAAALGITVCCASGDQGSSDGVANGVPTVDFPAASPYVLGCGGTHIQTNANKITSEAVWNDLPQGGASGGGISTVFALPAWQRDAHVPLGVTKKPGRGVPDVAANADPFSGYLVFLNGRAEVVGGTSTVAPLWAGLLARINQLLGRSAGYLNPLLYSQLPNDVLLDVTTGNNGAYGAATGWDPCTGLGSPDGTRLLGALQPATSSLAATSA